MPLGAAPADTAEFMLGRVAVVPVLLESNGKIDANTENWTPALIEAAITKVRIGVNWWSETLDRLGTKHALEFVVDETFARTPVSTDYEPISRLSQQQELYVGSFLETQNLGNVYSIESAIRAFNHRAREKHNADWAFTIFMVNATNDDDGQFASGSEFTFAFAFAGGMYIVMPSTRPASTVAHETGHIFWARDEYPGAGSWTDRRGYYNAQNLNAANNPTTGFIQQASIMSGGVPLSTSFDNYTLPASTRAMIGWQDSDGDGIFDVSDVPLNLEGTGWYDRASGKFNFRGSARAVALPNRNSWGFQNDITLNRVDRLEYRLDGGPWQTAATLGFQTGDVDISFPVSPYSKIEIRAIDDRLGITSNIFAADEGLPMLAGATLGGGTVLVGASEGETTPSPQALAGVTVRLIRVDGPAPLLGSIDPNDFTLSNPPAASQVTLRATGIGVANASNSRVGSIPQQGVSGARVFGFIEQSGSWRAAWGNDSSLEVSFATPVGRVSLRAIGALDVPGYGRMEAFDANGKSLGRVTSSGLTRGKSAPISIEDSAGRIASVKAYGHAGIPISFGKLEYGVRTEALTEDSGVFDFSGLPSGDYRVDLTPPNWIYRPQQNGQVIPLRDGVTRTFVAEFARALSPWTNPRDRFDVSNSGSVEGLDALLVLNDLARKGERILQDPQVVTTFFDTNDDGRIQPLDALLVINEMARRQRVPSSGEASTDGQAETPAFAADRFFSGFGIAGEDDDEEPAGLPADGYPFGFGPLV
jgi:hypothetical protein